MKLLDILFFLAVSAVSAWAVIYLTDSAPSAQEVHPWTVNRMTAPGNVCVFVLSQDGRAVGIATGPCLNGVME